MAGPNSDSASIPDPIHSNSKRPASKPFTFSVKPGTVRVKDPLKQMAGSQSQGGKRKHSNTDTQSPHPDAGTPDAMTAEDTEPDSNKKLKQLRQSTTKISNTIPLSETNPVFIDVDGRAIKYTHLTAPTKGEEISIMKVLKPYSLRISDGIPTDAWETDLSAELLKGLSLYDQKNIFPTIIENDGHSRVRAKKQADLKYKDAKAVKKTLKAIEQGAVKIYDRFTRDPNHSPFGSDEEVPKMGVMETLLGASLKPSKSHGDDSDVLKRYMNMFMIDAEKIRRGLSAYHLAQQDYNKRLAEKEQDLGQMAIYLHSHTSNPLFHENLPPRVVEILEPTLHLCQCLNCIKTRDSGAYERQVEDIVKGEREKIRREEIEEFKNPNNALHRDIVENEKTRLLQDKNFLGGIEQRLRTQLLKEGFDHRRA